MNINDWKLIQARNDLKYIKNRIDEKSIVKISFLFEILLVMVGFALDHIFSSETEQHINLLWIVLASIGIVIPIAVYLINKERIKKRQLVRLRVGSARELVSLFDDELCYQIMTAESFSRSINKMSSPKSQKDALLLEFYIIEEAYYLKKAILILWRTDNNLSSVLNKKDDSYFISTERLVNAIGLLSTLYDELICFSNKESEEMKKYNVNLDLESMNNDYQALKSFSTRAKELIENGSV